LKALAAIVAAAVLAAVGVLAGWLVRGDQKPDAVTVTVATTVTTRSAAVTPGVPAAVERTRAAIERAARAKDYEALRALVPTSGFSYTFGPEPAGGAIAFWQELEQNGETPLATLAKILSLPFSLRQGLYVWPFAYGTPRGELTTYERSLLGTLADAYVDEDYYGWRAGIKPDGSWAFFVKGD
jgi:hypothetical protein